MSRISLSQLRSKLRQIQDKQRRAINDYNSAVRRRHESVRRAVDNYNREARAYNARVRSQRQRIQSELRRLQSRPATLTVTIRTSAVRLHESYARLESRFVSQSPTDYEERLLALSENESANSLRVANMFEDPHATEPEDDEELGVTTIGDQLRTISADLDGRWRGALFSLDPQNPDAARHFCTSAREIFTQILELRAPDAQVASTLTKLPAYADWKANPAGKSNLFAARKRC